MYPDLFGIDNFSYALMIAIGVATSIFGLSIISNAEVILEMRLLI